MRLMRLPAPPTQVKGIESFLNDAMKEFWEGQKEIAW